MTDDEKINPLTEALKAHRRVNRLKNDTDAYLWAMIDWAFGEGDDRPAKEDYGINGE